MSGARRMVSYRYVQGTSSESAPSLRDDYDYDDDYQEDEDEEYDDYEIEEPQVPSQGHSPSGGSRTLQYALGSSSSQPPSVPTFDSIAEAVTRLQNRFSAPSPSDPNPAPSLSSAGAPTHPYERPPSIASSDTSYTVATDYAAPSKIRQASRFQAGSRPFSQQPPRLPTIDSGEPLQWDEVDVTEEEDPFSDGSLSQRQSMLPYVSNAFRRGSLDSSSSHDCASTIVPGEETLHNYHRHPPRPPSQLSAATSQSAGSSNRGPSPVNGVTAPQWQVSQLPAPSQERAVEPTVGLVSRPNPAHLPHHNSYDQFQSQSLTPPTNRIVQRRSPLKPVSPIDHFRHDTEAYASGRNSLPSYTIPRSRSPTPAIGDDSYEVVSDISRNHTGTSYYAETHSTGTGRYSGRSGGMEEEEYDEETLEGDEEDGKVDDEPKEKPNEKSKFQQFLSKARNQGDAFLSQALKEKPKDQNVFADPRRVVFPSTISDVPETPVETRHFGPAPIGRVARRNKTTKQVPLTNGNLVLDLPVPPKLVLPRSGHPEVMKTRYTAVTCDPDDFEKNGHFLRQNQMHRRTELFICITMYNVSVELRINLNSETKSVPRKTRSYSVGHYTASCAILRIYARVKTRIHGALRHGRR